MSSTLVLSDVGDQTWAAILEDGRVVELHVENTRRPDLAGDIYKGRIRAVLPGMESAFVDLGTGKDAFLHAADLPIRDGEQAAPIQDLLREGQEIVVQIAREAIGSKGPRVTALPALPGRVLVYLPLLSRVSVSRRIEDPAERERLAAILDRFRPAVGGWIVRTAAEHAGEEVVERDAVRLTGLWSSLVEKEGRTPAPGLLHRDLGLAERLLRDVISDEFREVLVDSERLRAAAIGCLEDYVPKAAVAVRCVADGSTLFDEMGIHLEIERALKPRIWLASGGSIVVNPTEAFVAIDVNTGGSVGRHDLEETALRTNLEAVSEIVRMLRLRDLGGIIVIDFIDLVRPENRETLCQALAEELRKDRQRTKLLGMSEIGIVQLTRKRTRRSLDRALLDACPSCEGTGRIRSAMALYYEIQHELIRGAALAGPDGPAVRLHPAAQGRLEEEGLRLGVVRRGSEGEASPIPVHVVPDPALSEDGYEIVW